MSVACFLISFYVSRKVCIDIYSSLISRTYLHCHVAYKFARFTEEAYTGKSD